MTLAEIGTLGSSLRSCLEYPKYGIITLILWALALFAAFFFCESSYENKTVYNIILTTICFDRKVSVQEMKMHEIEDTMTNGKYKQKAKKKN